ncbi:LlaJI family restriction endonuclease [Yersinia kristensenii]|uniref:LlaJI family restriction endonuclease n=1 Tax=Yersinia kristensenii TaxID=28152 RepID=UPI0028534AB0|nr:LlaJI family restriction endonuclease [Yersinia kristensenii]MDR4899346.1 LlaJI family restriction endonuclease [Yersinia kristensenii]
MVDLQFFYDRQAVSALPDKLSLLMKLSGIIAPDHSWVHYCGFVSWAEGLAVFMPRNSSSTSATPIAAYNLLRALQRYYAEKSSVVTEGDDSGLIGGFSLSLISNLTDDYVANGLYVRRKKQCTLNQSRTDWKRTVSRQTPFPSGSAPFYLDLETSRIRYVSDCEVSRIHAQVIKEINRNFGVLLFGQNTLTDERLEQLPPPLGDTETLIAQLDRELIDSYSERDISLITMLKLYIERHSATTGPEVMIGTRNFHHVWEGMLDSCLSNKILINSKLPVPYYLQNDNYIEVARKGQRTDTVITNKSGSAWAIIDAKYYDASAPRFAPGWHDLVKQFFYKTAAEEVCTSKLKITLHFIFPGIHSEKNLVNVKVGERGQGSVAKSEFKTVEKYHEILCHYCDPLVLMKKYVRGSKLDISKDKDISGEIFSD